MATKGPKGVPDTGRQLPRNITSGVPAKGGPVTRPVTLAQSQKAKFADLMIGNEPSPFYFSGGKYPIVHGEGQTGAPAGVGYLPALGLRNEILKRIYGQAGVPSGRLASTGRALAPFENDLYSPSRAGNRADYLQSYTRDLGYNPLLTNLQALAGNIYTTVIGQGVARRNLERQKKTYLDLAGTITPGPVGQIIGGAGQLSQH